MEIADHAKGIPETHRRKQQSGIDLTSNRFARLSLFFGSEKSKALHRLNLDSDIRRRLMDSFRWFWFNEMTKLASMVTH